MTVLEWRQSPELVTWARTSPDFDRVLDVLRRALVSAVAVQTQDGVSRGWAQCFVTLESLKQPLEEVKEDAPQTYGYQETELTTD